MATWRQYQLGGRIRRLDGGAEERLALDRSPSRSPPRSSGRPVTVRTYPRESVANVGRGMINVGANIHLARPLELTIEGGEVLVVRELSFGPSLGDVIGFGPQSEPVVAAILDQLLDGLSVLHAAGVPHLRLSPVAARFDLLSGALKLGDLEESGLLPSPSLDLIPRFLEPDVRVGLGGVASDIFSVGRLGEALLRGGTPLGAWGTAPPSAPGPLWAFLMRCQGSVADGRPQDAAAALVGLRALGMSPAGGASLPLARFVRAHVGSLRELRRWRAQPLPPVEEGGTRRYREVLSAGEAAKLWSLVGAGGMAAVLFSVYLAGAPAHSSEAVLRFTGDACSEDVHASIVADAAGAPKDFAVVTLKVPPDAAVAIDGCPLVSVSPGEAWLAVEPGLHDLRGSIGEQIATLPLKAKIGDHPVVDLESAAQVRGDGLAALSMLAKLRAQPAEEPADRFDPVAVGMIEPNVRHLLAVDAAKIEPDVALRDALPDSVALALDGARAALRRFKVAAAPCEGRLSAEVDKVLGPPTADVDDGDLRKAVALLTVTRIRGPELRQPLRIEAEALSELGVTPARRMLSAVSTLAEQPEIASCLDALNGPVQQIDKLSALVLLQIPGALDEAEGAEDDSTE